MSRVLGSIRQNGYVVHDIETALLHWTETLGVGPFWLFDRVPVENFQYQGEPSPIEVSIALANSGDLQVELIQQHNDAPSMYRDFLAAGNEGLQHVAYWSEDFDADFARARQAGWSVGQAGQIGSDGRFVYFDTDSHPGAHPGTVVELSEVSGAKGRFFSRIAEAAASWDGADPIRRR